MRSVWRDGARERTVEITALGDRRYRVLVDGAEHVLTAEVADLGRLRLTEGDGCTLALVTAVGDRRFVRVGSMDFVLDRATAGRSSGGRGGHDSGLEAPMPGVVTRVMVAAGDSVKRGQPLLAVEAMKMEHMIRAPRDARVKTILASVGEMVRVGVPLVELDG